MVAHSEPPRALITGIGGFTGRYLAAELADAGYSVFGTTHPREPVRSNAFQVDLCDRAALRNVVREVKPHVVAHLAAISFVGHSDPDSIYQVNVLGTRHLLQALAEVSERPKAVLLASSANVYGNATTGLIDEAAELSPENDYAVSKLAMEYMARLWTDQLPLIVVRPFNYTGVGQAEHFLVPKIISHFRRGDQSIELGNIDVERDFSDVRIVAKIYRRLLEKPPVGEVLNVCSGSSATIREILKIMSGIAGYKIDFQVNPAFVRRNEVKILRGCSKKLLSKLPGISNDLQAYALADTLRWMYNEHSC